MDSHIDLRPEFASVRFRPGDRVYVTAPGLYGTVVELEAEQVIVNMDNDSFALGYRPDELQISDSAPGEFTATVTENMRAAIAADGRSVAEIAAAAGVSVDGLTSVLAGRVAPFVHDVILVAITLGVAPSDWCRRAEEVVVTHDEVAGYVKSLPTEPAGRHDRSTHAAY
ncbi:hypothetical protein [Nocardia barduliensis]|uniref:hypothetical protein n=1 Tax=Nocardia barduliensis TaxID=2736643 RepID=UPI0015741967|nr:hypothetical protein [Nocardia barduliensis]